MADVKETPGEPERRPSREDGRPEHPVTERSRLSPGRAMGLAGGLLLGATSILAHKYYEMRITQGMLSIDAGVFALIGRGIVQGGLPYRDFWDHKPPGMYYLDALVFAVSPANPASLRVAETLVALLSLPVFFWLLRTWTSTWWASVGTAAYGLFSTPPEVNQGGNIAETYMLLPTVVAYGCAFRYMQEAGKPRYLWMAGIALGFAALLKPQAALHLAGVDAAVVLAALRTPLERSDSRSGLAQLAARCTIPAGGLLLVVLPVALYFVLRGVGAALWSQVVVYNRAFAAAAAATLTPSRWQSTLDAMPHMRLLWYATALACAVVALALLLKPSCRVRMQWPVAAILLTWTILDWISAVSDLQFFPHDFLLTVPSSVALLTFGLSQASHAISGRLLAPSFGATLRNALSTVLVAGLFGVVGVVICASFILGGVVPAVAGPSPQRTDTRTYRLMHEVAAAMAASTRPADYVYVWGYEAGLYFAADRRPASRFIYNSPLVNRFGFVLRSGYATGELRREFFADLERRPPMLIVVTRNDEQTVGLLPRFQRLIEERYRLIRRIDGYRLYRRR